MDVSSQLPRLTFAVSAASATTAPFHVSSYRPPSASIIAWSSTLGSMINYGAPCDVVCVLQWWVDEKFTIFGVQQRMGRPVRDPSLVGVGVVYVQKSLLNDIREGEWQSAWSDPNRFPEDEQWDPDTGRIRVIPVSKSRKLPFFGLPVRK